MPSALHLSKDMDSIDFCDRLTAKDALQSDERDKLVSLILVLESDSLAASDGLASL